MTGSNIEFIERILKVFKLPYTFEKENKSEHWKIYNNRNYDLLNLINFRAKNSLSLGLDDQYKINYPFLKKVLKIVDEKFLLDNLDDLNIGNSYNYKKIKGKIFDYNKIIHICWVKIILDKIGKVNNHCEIGQGFGSLTSIIIKSFNPNKILLIDLPEANLLSAYYLKNLYPKKKFFLYDQYLENNKLSYDNFRDHDIIILPPECELDKKIKFDLFISARSFMEMKSKYINKYFKFIENRINENGFFLNINRYKKASSGEIIKLENYPYTKNTWEVVVSKKSFNQNLIHFLLAKKKISESLDLELVKIKNIRLHLKKKINIKFTFFYKIKKLIEITFGKEFLNFISKIFFKLKFKKLSLKIRKNIDID